MATELGLNNVISEGDALSVISMSSGKLQHLQQVEVLIGDIHLLGCNVLTHQFQIVCRDGNQGAQ